MPDRVEAGQRDLKRALLLGLGDDLERAHTEGKRRCAQATVGATPKKK
jgi:hypothetical protein